MEFQMDLTESDSTFPSPAGSLYRRSIVPVAPWSTLALIHGYGDHSGRHAHFMRWLAERGVACHALDLRGQGRSPGRRAFVRRWEDYLDDLDAFLRLPDLHATRPLFLLGHSHGGLLVCAAAIRLRLPQDVTGCVLTSPFFHNRMHVPAYKRLLARAVDPLLPWLRLGSGLSDAMMSSDAAMCADTRADPYVCRVATPRWYRGCLAAQQEVLAAAPQFRLPLLMLCGGADPLADPAAAEQFFRAAGSTEKQFKLYPDLLHELLRETAREDVFAEILIWLRTQANRAGATDAPARSAVG
jgi:alpha-beta hydrolase superfamily lysophospholipase